MRRIRITALIVLTAGSAFLLLLSFAPFAGGAPRGLSSVTANDGLDPDLPPDFIGPPSGFSKEDFMLRRAEGIALKRGIDKDKPFDPRFRQAAIAQMERQEALEAQKGSP